MSTGLSTSRVMITGGSGFVGLAVAEAVLAQGGHPILLADRPPPPALLDALPGPATVMIVDIRESTALARAFATAGPTHVVHGAALTPAPEDEVALADALVAVNVGGTARLVQAAAGAGVVRIVLLSSVAVYGPVSPAGGALLTEDRPPAPAALYGISKFAAEMVARRLADRLGVDLAIVRLGPVFGPFEHETGVRGLMSPQWQILRQAMAGQATVLPWTLEADWIYARDVGAGVASLLPAALAEGGRLSNLGSGAVTGMPAWAACLAPHFPGWSCRIAAPGEPATVRYGLTEARAAMSTDRLAAATGFRARFDTAAAASDYLAWSQRLA